MYLRIRALAHWRSDFALCFYYVRLLLTREELFQGSAPVIVPLCLSFSGVPGLVHRYGAGNGLVIG